MRGGQESVHGAVSGCIVTRPAVGRNAERKYDYQELYLIVRLFLICIDKIDFVVYNYYKSSEFVNSGNCSPHLSNSLDFFIFILTKSDLSDII